MNAKQLKFLEALLSQPTISKAVETAQISRAQGYRWLKDETFKGEFESRKMEVLQSCVGQMQQGFEDAVSELLQIIRNSRTAPQIKINAIDCLFRNWKPLAEQCDVMAKLSELEERMKGIEDANDEQED